jgi:GIY-YIG catalytic domain
MTRQVKVRPGMVLAKRLAEAHGEWVEIADLDAALLAAGRQNAIKKTGAYLGDITRYSPHIIQRGYIGQQLAAARLIDTTPSEEASLYRVVTDERRQEPHYYQWGIYRFTNTVTKHFYIGQAGPFGRRWRTHLNALMTGRHHSQKLQKAWNKYDPEVFKFDVLLVTPVGKPELLDLYEGLLVNAFAPEYNIRGMNGTATSV